MRLTVAKGFVFNVAALVSSRCVCFVCSCSRLQVVVSAFVFACSSVTENSLAVVVESKVFFLLL